VRRQLRRVCLRRDDLAPWLALSAQSWDSEVRTRNIEFEENRDG
jgi:hypothetical protein